MDTNGNGEMKMLKIIEFIKSHKNWNELLVNPPYSLNIKEKENLVLFNYSQIATDASIPLTKEARGLILEKNNWNVICYGFNRFFNIGETNAAQIDWESAFATSKEDGTLFFLYYYNDDWHVKTRSTFDAKDAPLENGRFKNYKELFDYMISFYPKFNFSKLNKKYTYCLEGCSQFNKIVIDYPEVKLFHILTRNNETFEEINEDIGIPKPAYYYLENKEDYQNFVSSMGKNREGIVVQDKFNRRVKIKTEHYFMLHYLTNKVVLTLRRTISLIRKNDYEEILAYFPHYRPWVEEVKEKLGAAAQKNVEINTEVAKMKETCANRKEFVEALKSKSKNDFRLYMLAYDNNLDNWFAYDPEASEAVETKKIADIIKYYELDK